MVKISLIGKTETIVLPINPPELRTSRRSDNKNVTIIGTGEIVIPGKTGLASFSIESFFWDDDTIMAENWMPSGMKPAEYVNAIHKMQSEQSPGNPIRFVAEGLGMDMYVLIQSFDSAIKSGEETDRYYSLNLIEYRPYGAQLIEVEHMETPKTEDEKQSEAKSTTIDDLSVGQIVDFIGGFHYTTSSDSVAANKNPRSAGKATLTNIKKDALHPLHLIGTAGGSNVYGWVDGNTVSGITYTSTNVAKSASNVIRSEPKPQTPNPYISKQGDTFYSITRKYAPNNVQAENTSIGQLIDANKGVFEKMHYALTASVPAGSSINIPKIWIDARGG